MRLKNTQYLSINLELNVAIQGHILYEMDLLENWVDLHWRTADHTMNGATMTQTAGIRVLVTLPIRSETAQVEHRLLQGAGAQRQVGSKVSELQIFVLFWLFGRARAVSN